MGQDSKIQWCHHTYNPWRGCRKVAPECANCYITQTTPFRTTGQTHGSVRVRAGKATLKEPLKWDRAALKLDLKGYGPGEEIPDTPRVFCLSLGDWLDDENVPIAWFADLMKTVCETPHLNWLLLTKRPQNWRARIHAGFMETACGSMEADEMMSRWEDGTPPTNVWIGVSAGADQSAALDIPALVHFLSCEPMLRPLDTTYACRFNWIIFGGESGPNARRCEPWWIRDGLQFCKERRIAAFVKQMGGNLSDKALSEFAAKTGTSMHDKKGGNPGEWPEEFRVREFPTAL